MGSFKSHRFPGPRVNTVMAGNLGSIKLNLLVLTDLADFWD